MIPNPVRLTKCPTGLWAGEVERDERLLERLRRTLAGRPGVVEKRMVGGRSFAFEGRMFCGVTSAGLMIRVGSDAVAAIIEKPHVSRMTMGGRPLSAFVVVAAEAVATDEALMSWIQRGFGTAAPGGAAMSAADSSPAERFARLVDQFAGTPGITVPEQTGKRGFGSSALRVGGSIFAMLTQGRLVVKLPRTRVTSLIENGSGEAFTAGKAAAMKEWLTVTTDEPAAWLELAREALDFVGR